MDASTPFTPPAWVTAPPRLTQRFPRLYPVAVLVHRARRRLRWMTSRDAWARSYGGGGDLAHRVKRHESPLVRRLGDSEMWLQRNKVTNLGLAAARVDRIMLRPGETFSFNRVVGNCTRRKGYVDGMRLSDGEAQTGVGGGICQLANLLHWLVLHSALTVVERSEHSFDPFPDNGRVLPWGVGCSIAYNYVDLVFRNETVTTFELRVRVGDRHLHGELRADRPPEHSYQVFARGEQFLRHGTDHYRRNEVWRRVIDRRTGDTVREELLMRNCALVKYVPSGVPVLDAGCPQGA